MQKQIKNGALILLALVLFAVWVGGPLMFFSTLWKGIVASVYMLAVLVTSLRKRRGLYRDGQRPTTDPIEFTLPLRVLIRFGWPATGRKQTHNPPLSLLDAIAHFFWSEKTYVMVFKPARAELMHELYEARDQRWKARWIRWVRGPFTLITHMLFQLPVSLLRRLVELYRTTK